jgi:hypothetical protein
MEKKHGGELHHHRSQEKKRGMKKKHWANAEAKKKKGRLT